ncbi:unnamed protein product [Rotaria sordida]|uniref:G domain-containing protein n=1 Tax=Rotaria sordida TaxID=392033 RepID=A0A819M7K9_9BILA|nr:unnamed protein product [Rotaria sordida]
MFRSIFPREKPDGDKWINIVVIGETGAGKSTFINTLTNYFSKGSLNNLKVAIPTRFLQATESFDHTEKDINDVTKSKTDMCHHYTFEDEETGKHYLFIDTPGLNDTRGVDQDALNIPKIRQAIADLGHLSAVILVIPGSLCRLTAGMQSVLIGLRGNLPDVVLDNVIVVLTSVQRHTSNFPLDCLEINGNVFPYYMQNSAFSKDPRRRTEEDIVSLKADWKDSMKEIKAMLQKINTFQTKSVAAFKDLEDQRNIIKALMAEAKLEVTNIQKMQDEIASLEQALKKYGDDESAYQQYTQETVVDETTLVGHDIFQGCVAMREGQCTQCPLLCGWAEHFHAKKTIQIKQQTVEKVLEDIKAKYDIATQGTTDATQKLTNLNDNKQMLKEALNAKNEEIKRECIKIKKICGGFNLVDELYATINLLQLEAKNIKDVNARQQAEEFIQNLTEFCDSLEDDTQNQINKSALKPKPKIQDTYVPIDKSELPYEEDSFSRRSDTNSPRREFPNRRALGNSRLDLRAYNDDDENEQQHPDTEAKAAKLEQMILKNKALKNNSKTVIPILQANMTSSNTSISSSSTAATITADQFDSMKIPDLLIKHTAYYQNRDLENYQLVQKELENRASGKSLGPLTSNEQDSLFDFRTQFEKYDSARLSQEYIDLQQTINKAIEVDIQQISKIPFTTLLKIAAIYMLLQKHQQQRNKNNNNGAYNISQAQRASPTQSMSSIGRGSGTYTSPSNMQMLPQEFQTIHTSAATVAAPIGFHGHITTNLLTNSFQNLSLSDESNRVLVSHYMAAVNSNNYVERNLISEELKHRLDGERFGRKTSEENARYESLRSCYSSQSVQFIQQQYKHLHDKIGAHVQDMLPRILDISADDLLTLCVLYTLLPGNPPSYSAYSFSHHNTPHDSTTLRQNQPSAFRPIVPDLPYRFPSTSPYQEFRKSPYNEIENATTTAFKQGNTTMSALLSLHDDYCHPASSNKSSSTPQSTFERHCGEKTITLTKEGATIYDSELDEYKFSTYEQLKLIYSAMIKMRVQPEDDDADHIKKAAEQATIRATAILHLLKLKEKENENLNE